MKGGEFRNMRLRVGWSIRVAATKAGVSPNTIVAWEARDAEVTSTAADAVREAAGLVPNVTTVAYALGRIMRCCADVWERAGGELPLPVYEGLPVRPADHLGPMLAGARARSPRHYRMVEDEIQEHMQRIPPNGLPERLTIEQQGPVWLGYYHQIGRAHV